MANLRITRLGHGGVLYRSPGDRWVWVDRWGAAPNFPAEYRQPQQVDVIAPTHGHFDHIGDDGVDVMELAAVGGQLVCSHEMSVYFIGKGIEGAVGMNRGGTFEAAGIRFSMVHAEHSGGVTITDAVPAVTRDLGCWGWVIEFEDGTRVYHSGDTDLFGDMALVRERWSPSIAVLPIGGHYTMGPADAARAAALVGARTVIPVHYATFPALAGTPAELRGATDAEVVELQPGETWEVTT
ncbi:MAG TPA: metal-dependent hydrolase [candidate division Zixibacteria bacterium]|nr:metal-dependent hydrolase [candidate division Zixibacteria bacterium]